MRNFFTSLILLMFLILFSASPAMASAGVGMTPTTDSGYAQIMSQESPLFSKVQADKVTNGCNGCHQSTAKINPKLYEFEEVSRRPLGNVLSSSVTRFSGFATKIPSAYAKHLHPD